MLDNKFITKEDYDSAIKEKVAFQPKDKYGIRAPHFVEFIKQYIADKYGDDALLTGGLKVITTLDYDLQAKTEEIVKQHALSNEKTFNGKNAAAVIIDPKTGQILTMVGSRDYFDTTIDGNFNVTIAHRQPGSTFKPFVYATAFEKGYTPDTVLFDVPTEFSTTCNPDGTPINPNMEVTAANACYMPVNYDGKYLGPISLRNALAQSRNIPSIKLLYLAGIKDSIRTAKDMGIKSLSDDPNQYGLTLVLGGGEVSLLDMTSAYGVFANDGVRTPYTGILSIEDSSGKMLEQFTAKPSQALPNDIAERIDDILSDYTAKIPAYGENSPLYFPGKQVASKTGTTNDYKDAWSIGYTPEIVVGTWAGNNDNTPMNKVAGLIVAPMWHDIMQVALASTTGENFVAPPPIDPNTKPILLGNWKGNPTTTTVSNTTYPLGFGYNYPQPVTTYNIHSILYWIDKNNPTGPAPVNPADDPQYNLWEYGIQKWLAANPILY
jgi:membrane peptidoglycan carboxypeptidase